MNERATPNAKIEKTENGWRLGIQKGDSLGYRDAQLDDYSLLPRHKFPHRTLCLGLRARASSSSLPGTWGFGLWNDPFGNSQGRLFGLSLGFGRSPFRLPALPNAVWFFYASKENHLSFASGLDTGEKNTHPTQPPAANGFMAQTFRSPKFHPLLIPASLALPCSRRTTRKLLSKVIDEDGVTLSVDVTQWHGYRLEWSEKRVVWYVDDVLVFESLVSPNPPLGVIIWIDNQFAAFTPEGGISFGVLEGGDERLEVENIMMRVA